MNAKQRRKVLRQLKAVAARPEHLVALRLGGATSFDAAQWVNRRKKLVRGYHAVSFKLYQHITRQLGLKL